MIYSGFNGRWFVVAVFFFEIIRVSFVKTWYSLLSFIKVRLKYYCRSTDFKINKKKPVYNLHQENISDFAVFIPSCWVVTFLLIFSKIFLCHVFLKIRDKSLRSFYNLQKANKYSQNTKLWQEKQRLTSRSSGPSKRTTQEMKVVCRAAPFPAGPDELAKQGALLSRLCHLRCVLASRLYCELALCSFSLRVGTHYIVFTANIDINWVNFL